MFVLFIRLFLDIDYLIIILSDFYFSIYATFPFLKLLIQLLNEYWIDEAEIFEFIDESFSSFKYFSFCFIFTIYFINCLLLLLFICYSVFVEYDLNILIFILFHLFFYLLYFQSYYFCENYNFSFFVKIIIYYLF